MYGTLNCYTQNIGVHSAHNWHMGQEDLKKVRFPVRFDPKLLEWLRIEAHNSNRSVTNTIETLLLAVKNGQPRLLPDGSADNLLSLTTGKTQTT